jgi:protein gp37
MENSKIAWTDHTFNPWWGCMKVSPGCHHCYAETFAKRVGRENLWGAHGQRRTMSASYWRQPLKWNQEAADAQIPPRVFCASMADVFEDRPDVSGDRQKLWALIEMTPNLDWLLLTKRPENILRLFPARWEVDMLDGGTTPENVWMMTTTEDQARFDERMPHMALLTSSVIGISVEPMLGPIDLSQYSGCIDWVICGGESGPGARPMDVAWARDLAEQCNELEIPFFMKQMGSVYMREHGLTGKGDQLEDLPEDLRIREFPSTEY